jgi:hypothetical protein
LEEDDESAAEPKYFSVNKTTSENVDNVLNMGYTTIKEAGLEMT